MVRSEDISRVQLLRLTTLLLRSMSYIKKRTKGRAKKLSKERTEKTGIEVGAPPKKLATFKKYGDLNQ